jgi:hypothetical protein
MDFFQFLENSGKKEQTPEIKETKSKCSVISILTFEIILRCL